MAETAMLGLMAVGSALGVVGNIRQGESDREQAEFAATESEAAAGRSERNALAVIAAAKTDERKARQESGQVLGSIRAAFGANGVGTDGSSADYLAYQTAVAEENALDIRHEGVLRSLGYKEEAKTHRRQAEQYRKSGSAAYKAGMIGAAGALVKGGGQIAGHYYEGGRASTRDTSGTGAKVPKMERGR